MQKNKPNGEDHSPPNFPTQWVATAALSLQSNAIIKGFIERGSFNVIYGPSGSGKSFLTADICQHIARGIEWRERRTKQCLVVYVAAEAGASIMRRFIGWRNEVFSDGAELTAATLPLAVLTRGPDLLEQDSIKNLASDIITLETDSGHKVGLVVFDTLSRSIPGGDENSAVDMTKAVKAADFLRDTFGCATIYVHHSGKDPERGARGHSALKAACDLQILVDERLATVEKVRDGISGEKFYFTLQGIILGDDDEGDPVGTCMVQYADAPQRSARGWKPTGKNQKIVLPILKALLSSSGQKMPETSAVPKGVVSVTFDALVAHAVETKAFLGREPKRVRESVADAISGMRAAGAVGAVNDYIWLS